MSGLKPLTCEIHLVWSKATGLREWFRAIIRLFCDLQSARHPLFRQLAQVINPLKFILESKRTTRKKP
ncbi:hypothetical protein B9Z51_00200 [Limnohabitans sp. T6-5]|nr:hypothetical protein B9Z51_00200 [Limnohabitans sp. T6-5]